MFHIQSTCMIILLVLELILWYFCTELFCKMDER